MPPLSPPNLGKPVALTDEKGTAYGVKRTGNTPHVILTDIGETPINPATEGTLSQLVMAVTNAIDETVHDLNAAAFSEVTAISNDYELDNVEFNFTTTAPRTITITTADGTLILNEEDNTDLSFIYKPSSEIAFNGGDNLTVTVTQAGSACLMDCILKIKQGSNTLAGDPVVQGVDQILGGNAPIPVDRDGRYVPVIAEEHTRIHESKGFTLTGKRTVASGSRINILIKNPAGNFPHFRFYAFASEKAPADIFLYEGTTVSVDGTELTPRNNNRNSSNVPNITLHETPTITDDGEEIEYSLIAGGKHTGGTAESITVEWILQPDQNYLLRYINNSGQSSLVGFHIFFYETAELSG